MLGCVPPSFMLLLMCCMPETPRFLLTQHKRQEAMAAVQFLWGSEQGWEEPPLGAEQQVRSGRQKWREGVVEVAPLCSLFSRLHVCMRTHTEGGSVALCVSEQSLLEPHSLAGPEPWRSLGKPEP